MVILLRRGSSITMKHHNLLTMVLTAQPWVWYTVGKGETCKKMIRENRESVTINPFVSLAGE